MKVYTQGGQSEQVHIRHESRERAELAAVKVMGYLAQFDEPERIFFIDEDDVAAAPFVVLSVPASAK